MVETQGGLPRICLLASAETSAAVLYGLYDVLSTVGAVFGEMTSGVAGNLALDVKIVGQSGAPFRCFGNVMVEPHAGIGEVESADAAIVCDMYHPIDVTPRGRYPDEISWLKRMHQRGAIVCSVCSGSLILAEAGLLDGLQAAGHWAYRDLFRQYYPAVKFKENSILNLSGKAQRIVTAGSVSSWQDLAVYLIARLCGPEHALRTTKIHLLFDRAEGQLPFAVMTPRIQDSDAVIADCQDWIAANYAVANPVARMIARSGLKPRTFARRFLAATGYQPMEYVLVLRVEEAKTMLESGERAVETVGQLVGYEDPTSFRRLFKRKAGLSPAAYRRKFARILEDARA